MRKSTWGALLLAGSFLFASTASAQETVELNAEQLSLNNEAIRALKETPPDTERALKLVQAAMLVGDDNKLLTLTLGRVYQLKKECTLADEAFGNVLRLPEVDGVPSTVIDKRLALYRSELAECYGRVDVNCERGEITKVTVGEKEAACGKTVLVNPGTVQVVSKVGGEPEKTTDHFVESQKTLQIQVQLPEGYDQRVAISKAAKSTSLSHASAAAKSKAEATVLLEAREKERKAREKDKLAQKKAAESRAKSAPAKGVQDSGVKKQASPPAPKPEVDPFPGWMGSHIAAAAPVGGYTAQLAEDGFLDGGVTYGAEVSGIVGYQWSRFLAADAKLSLEYRQGNGFKLQSPETSTSDQIDERLFSLDFDPRFWLDFLGIGPALHYRNQSLQQFDETQSTNIWAGGLSVQMSTRGIQRGNGFFRIFARWLPLFVGSAQSIETGIEFAGRFASFGITYSFMDTSGVSNTAIRTTESVLFALGFKIPIVSPLSVED